MDLQAWGEAGLLAYLAEQLGGVHTPAWAEVGLGDDAAVFHMQGATRTSLVTTCDAMVEGVHFLPDHPPAALARRLLSANLSDLAAMGARPRVALLTLGAPGTTSRAWLEAFFTALREACQREETWLAGGDVNRDSSIHLGLFLLGEVEAGRALRMAGASPGEDLWVTGTLGDSTLGLQLLRKGIVTPAAQAFIQVYHEGRHRWREMRALASAAHLTAATDVSDGLAVDLPRLGRASQCGLVVDTEGLPLSEDFNDLTALGECDKLTVCLAGGEDFEIAFNAPASERERLAEASRRLQIRLTRIGRTEAGPPGRVRWLDGKGSELKLHAEGYDHFRGAL